jgi:hypothetical protein
MLSISLILAIVLSLFSTAVMSYISMAVPIGPWIAPTLVLCSIFFFKLLGRAGVAYNRTIACAVAAGSIGGIVATALAFSFPALYFLDPILFNQWMHQPFYFCLVMGALALSGGWFGLWIANMSEHALIDEQGLDFPIGQLVYKMIAVHAQVRKAIELMVGFIGTTVFCALQTGIGAIRSCIPRALSLTPSIRYGIISLPAIKVDMSLLPMLWAIGFVTGHMIAVPLLVGMATQVVVIGPLKTLWYSHLSQIEFVLAFGSGMVLSSTIPGLFKTAYALFPLCTSIWSKKTVAFEKKEWNKWINGRFIYEGMGVITVSFLFLTAFKFSFVTQCYLLIATAVCAYQIGVIAGEIGLAQLGRFATFVMVPAMLAIKLNFIQIVFISAFVEIAGGMVADVLFGRKMGRLADISSSTIARYQYIGLAVCCVSVGAVFWLLIHHFSLGTPDLMAIKAQSRQMLITIQQFSGQILILGGLFGIVLQYIKVNPMLVLGGLLMPIDFSLGLIGGGLHAYYLGKNKEHYYPFWSGVFAANSLWMLMRALCSVRT